MDAVIDTTLTTLDVDGGQVAYSDTGGSGAPLVLVHAGVFGAWFVPLAAAPELAGFRVIRILRAGYTDGPPPQRLLTFADHAAHCAAVLDALSVSGATVVGHSSGSSIVLQLALERPDLVGSLVLCEPPLLDDLVDPADIDVLHATLLVQGGDSPPQTHRLTAHLAAMLPDARVATIEGDNHLLPLRSPNALARLVAAHAAV